MSNNLEKREKGRMVNSKMVEYEEICIIKIENINRELSPYQKCRWVEEGGERRRRIQAAHFKEGVVKNNDKM